MPPPPGLRRPADAQVRLPAFAWGLGTAIGELPPFFAARAARLAGEEDEGHHDVMKLAEKADRDGLGTLELSERAMVISYRVMKHLGFVGIMLLASVRAAVRLDPCLVGTVR